MEKLIINDPREKDWNDIINKIHDPDLIYLYIKQNYENKNIKETLIGVPENKKDSVESFFKLEVFRATMQYVEEFAMYFIAYVDDYQNIGSKLVKTNTTREVKAFFNNVVKGEADEFSHKKVFMNFNDLLMELFGYNYLLKSSEYLESKESYDKLILESINTIYNDLIIIANYYLEHLRLYNAVKHGNRVFPLIQKSSKLGDEFFDRDKKNVIIAVCKDDNVTNSGPYTLIFPLEYIIDKSFSIAKKNNLLFKCIRSIIRNKLLKNKLPISFFTISSKNTPKKKYSKLIRNRNVMIIETPDDFNLENNFFRDVNAFKIILKGKDLFFHTKFEKDISLEYPIRLESEIKVSSDLLPNMMKNIKFNLDYYDLNITQYLDIVRINELQEKDSIKKIVFVNDLNNEKITFNEKSNLKFPKIFLNPHMDDLKFLSKIEKITGQFIPIPTFTSKKQELIIDKNLDKNLLKKEANEILSNLKSDDLKIIATRISTKIMDFNSKEVFSKSFDPIICNINFNFNNPEDEQRFKNEKEENPYKKMLLINLIDEIPRELIDKIELYVTDQENNEFPEIKNGKFPMFELAMYINYKSHFWYIERDILMIFKPSNPIYFDILLKR